MVIRLTLAALLLALSLLAVFKTPHALLWKPRVFATEWGHLLVFAALLLLLPGWRHATGKLACGISLAAALLAISPLLQGIMLARTIDARMQAAFAGDLTPRSLPGAPARSGPLVLSELLRIASPKVTLKTLVYREINGQSLALDLYLRDDAPTPRPIVIAVHGGSWNSGDSTQLPAINQYLAARGYAVAAINYRLAPGHIFPAAHDDLLAAIAYLQSNAKAHGLDPQRIVLLGRSAGGHLALLAAYSADNPAVKGVIAYYAPNDMLWSYQNPTNPLVLDSKTLLEEFLGGSLEAQPHNYHAASPLEFVDKNDPPTLLLHGSRDELVYARQSTRLAEQLRASGVPQLEIRFPWATHGLDANLAGPGGQISTYAIERFLAYVTR